MRRVPVAVLALSSAAACASIVGFPDVPDLESSDAGTHRDAAGHDAGREGSLPGREAARGDERPGSGRGSDAHAEAGDAGSHRDASDDIATCDGGTTLCGNVCVSEQADPGNCGGCGLVCTGTCAKGRCLDALIAADGGPCGVAVDDTSVYWITQGSSPGFADGTVESALLDGGARTAFASAQNHPNAIAVAGGNLYWATAGTLAAAYTNGAVFKISLAEPTITTTLATQQNDPVSIVVDTQSVYWVTYGGGGNGTIVKMPIGGGALTTLAASQPHSNAIALDATSVYWTTAGLTTNTGTVMKVASMAAFQRPSPLDNQHRPGSRWTPRTSTGLQTRESPVSMPGTGAAGSFSASGSGVAFRKPLPRGSSTLRASSRTGSRPTGSTPGPA